MSRPLIPPRGVFVPTELIFDRELYGQVFQTWVQLRALAWGMNETPALTFKQLAGLTGKSRSTIMEHMAALRDRGALRWRPAGSGTLIVHFPVESQKTGKTREPISTIQDPGPQASEIPDSGNPDSRNLEMPYPSNSSDPPPIIKESDSFEDISSSDFLEKKQEKREEKKEGGAIFQNSGKIVQDSGCAIQGPGKTIQGSGLAGKPAPGEKPTPAGIYQAVTGLQPGQQQANLMDYSVSDLDLWRSSLRHWMAHGWNPRSVQGMLDFYERGGQAACSYCRKPEENKRRPRSAYDLASESLEKLMRGR